MSSIKDKPSDQTGDILGHLDKLKQMETVHTESFLTGRRIIKIRDDGTVKFGNAFTALWRRITSLLRHIGDKDIYVTPLKKQRSLSDLKTKITKDTETTKEALKNLRKLSVEEINANKELLTSIDSKFTIETTWFVVNNSQKISFALEEARIVWNETKEVLQEKLNLAQEFVGFKKSFDAVSSYKALTVKAEKFQQFSERVKVAYLPQTVLPQDVQEELNIIKGLLDFNKEVLTTQEATSLEQSLAKATTFQEVADAKNTLEGLRKRGIPSQELEKKLQDIDKKIADKASECTTKEADSLEQSLAKAATFQEVADAKNTLEGLRERGIPSQELEKKLQGIDNQITAKRLALAQEKINSHTQSLGKVNTYSLLNQKNSDHKALFQELRKVYSRTIFPQELLDGLKSLKDQIVSKATGLKEEFENARQEKSKAIGELENSKSEKAEERQTEQNVLLSNLIIALETAKGKGIKTEALQDLVTLVENVLEYHLQQGGDAHRNKLVEDINSLAGKLGVTTLQNKLFLADLVTKIQEFGFECEALQDQIVSSASAKQQELEKLNNEIYTHTIRRDINVSLKKAADSDYLPEPSEVRKYIASLPQQQKGAIGFATLFLEALETCDKIEKELETQSIKVNEWNRAKTGLMEGAKALTNLVSVDSHKEFEQDISNQVENLTGEIAQLELEIGLISMSGLIPKAE